jgi:hypothetical protein
VWERDRIPVGHFLWEASGGGSGRDMVCAAAMRGFRVSWPCYCGANCFFLQRLTKFDEQDSSLGETVLQIGILTDDSIAFHKMLLIRLRKEDGVSRPWLELFVSRVGAFRAVQEPACCWKTTRLIRILSGCCLRTGKVRPRREY